MSSSPAGFEDQIDLILRKMASWSPSPSDRSVVADVVVRQEPDEEEEEEDDGYSE